MFALACAAAVFFFVLSAILAVVAVRLDAGRHVLLRKIADMNQRGRHADG